MPGARLPPTHQVRPRAQQVIGLAVFFAITFGAAFLGTLATNASVGSWYTTIAKPSWTPPGVLIGSVWTVLYTLMAIAGWLVWRQGVTRELGLPLSAYALQLALNAGWSLLFFGARAPGLALIEIVFLAGAVAATLIIFWRRVRLAGILFLPYLAWVCFAGFLNLIIWRMNR